jgi:hypothetical protein
MKICCIALLLSFFIPMVISATNLVQLRSLLDKAANESKYCDELSKAVGKEPDRSNAIIRGYLAMGNFMRAKHSYNPYSKCSFFSKGEFELEEALKNDKDNLELHFLRYSVQLNAPFFLGYRGHLTEDKNILITGWETINDKDLKARIKAFMLVYANYNLKYQ